MIQKWIKQFILGTGIFSLVLSLHALNLFMKEKSLANKALKEAHRSVRVVHSLQWHLN